MQLLCLRSTTVSPPSIHSSSFTPQAAFLLARWACRTPRPEPARDRGPTGHVKEAGGEIAGLCQSPATAPGVGALLCITRSGKSRGLTELRSGQCRSRRLDPRRPVGLALQRAPRTHMLTNVPGASRAKRARHDANQQQQLLVLLMYGPCSPRAVRGWRGGARGWPRGAACPGGMGSRA